MLHACASVRTTPCASSSWRGRRRQRYRCMYAICYTRKAASTLQFKSFRQLYSVHRRRVVVPNMTPAVIHMLCEELVDDPVRNVNNLSKIIQSIESSDEVRSTHVKYTCVAPLCKPPRLAFYVTCRQTSDHFASVHFKYSFF